MPSDVDRALRVLMATPRFSPDVGGVETHVYEVARRLVQKKVDVTVLTTDRRGHLPIFEELEGVQVRRVRAWPANRDWYLAPDVYRIITRGSWDLVHVQSYHTFVAPFAMQAAWTARIPYVVTFHGGGHSSALRNAVRGIQWQFLRPWLARAQRLIAVAKFEMELYGRALRIPLERFILIPNGFDITRPNDGAISDSNGTLILSIGRLERYKGHQRVIAALPHVVAQKPDARLRIVGAGPCENELRHMAQQLGVSDRVEIRGIPSSDRQGMVRLLQSASLVTLLSDYETHPISVLEALSFQRPVLVAENSGMRELAERGWARSVPTHSAPTEIAEAMLGQLNTPLVPQQIDVFTWDDCARQLLQLYQSLVKPKECAS